MAYCDLCGQHCKAGDMTTLLASYQIHGVEDICDPCRKWADKVKSDLLLAIAPAIRDAISARKAAQPPSPNPAPVNLKNFLRSLKLCP